MGSGCDGVMHNLLGTKIYLENEVTLVVSYVSTSFLLYSFITKDSADDIMSVLVWIHKENLNWLFLDNMHRNLYGSSLHKYIARRYSSNMSQQ